ncbi:peptidylprolyl isomerase, partial [Sulfolobus sp. A20-N-G8]
VSGGRVILDLNHPLAGRSLVYDVKVVKVLETPKDKIMALIERRFGQTNLKNLSVEINDEKKNVIINLSKDLYLLQNLQLNLYYLAYEIINYVSQDYTVQFIQQYSKSTFYPEQSQTSQ